MVPRSRAPREVLLSDRDAVGVQERLAATAAHVGDAAPRIASFLCVCVCVTTKETGACTRTRTLQKCWPPQPARRNGGACLDAPRRAARLDLSAPPARAPRFKKRIAPTASRPAAIVFIAANPRLNQVTGAPSASERGTLFLIDVCAAQSFVWGVLISVPWVAL